MKIFLRLLSLALALSSPFLLSMCKSEPDKPSIVSLAPAIGKEGDVVTIAGTFLGSTQKILFGTTEAAVVDPQGNQVTTQVPPGLTLGNVNVTVVNKGGNSNGVPFLVIPPIPEITGIAPSKGSSGMSVVMGGKYFSTAKSISFGASVVTSLNNVTDNAATVVVPDGLALGATNVTITTDGGTSVASSFTVVGKPTLTDFAPAAGPAGTHVTISGTNFAEATGVSFHDIAATTFTITNDNSIDAVVPASAATGKIKVITAGGEVLSVTDYIVKGAPLVSSFTPTSGPIGTLVTITGTDLSLAGVKVKFGGVEATELTITSDTEIKAKAPTGAASGKITVQTAAGTGISVTDFSVIGAPTITSFLPANGPVGTTVVVNGTNFINVSSVKFSGIDVGAANITINSSTKITTKVPAGATSGIVSVTTAAGTASSGTNFTINTAPTITTFAPTSGVVGASVVITGTLFTGTTGVKINGTTATTYTINSATQITATIPAAATTGKISVTTTGGTATSAADFIVIQVPFISSITPTSGQTGVTLTITGISLSGAKVRFNTTDVTSLISNTDTQIKVAVPVSLGTGAVNVSAITAGGTSNQKTFTVSPHVDPPIVTDLKPATSYKGFPIMIRGSKLKDATGVMIGTTAGTILTKYDASMIIMIPSSLANGTYNVTVSNAGGASNTSSLIIITAPAGVGSAPSANFVSPPPANYVNVISNNWDQFLLSTFSDNPNCPVVNPSDDTYCGHVTMTKDGAGNVIANYVEITRGSGSTLETLYGQYSATTAYPCVQKMVLISGKDGRLVIATIDLSGQIPGNYPNGGTTCTP